MQRVQETDRKGSGGVDFVRFDHHNERRHPLPYDRFRLLHGWGMSRSAPSWVYRPTTVEGIVEVFKIARSTGFSVGFRGAGRSYGDAPLNGENIVLDLTRMRRILEWNPETGVITLEPGVTVGDLWQYTIEDGWWPPVVPGTMYPTIGGCASMNIHGKNNYRSGPIGDHILSFTILTPAGEHLHCSRNQNAELFLGAIGGFGMLGCFTSITLQLKRVWSGLLSVRPYNVPGLAQMKELFDREVTTSEYVVGWVDAFARGDRSGRGVVHTADYLDEGEDPFPARTLRAENQALPEQVLGVLPKSVLWRFMRPIVNDPGMRGLNMAKYHASRLLDRGVPYYQSHAAFAFLLDYVPEWKRAYGPGGLLQYQSFIPAESAVETFTEMLAICRRSGEIPYLGVFKRHRPDDFLMTHAVDGFSLALDFRVDRSFRRKAEGLGRALTDLVLEAGGRFYFAKDSLLTPQDALKFLGEDRVRRFAELKRRHDPTGLLETNLARRLFGSQGLNENGEPE